MLQELRARVGSLHEQPQRLVQPPAVEVRIEVAQTWRQAAAHLPVGRGILAFAKPPAAMTKSEQGIELLDQLEREPPPAQRPNRDGMAGGGLACDLEDRVRDVEPAADVDQPVVSMRQPHVPGRTELLDETVLQHQRPQL